MGFMSRRILWIAVPLTVGVAAALTLLWPAPREQAPDHLSRTSPSRQLDGSGQALVADTAGTETGLLLHPELVKRNYDDAIRDVVRREDPVLDGWDSEHFSELAAKQLKTLGSIMEGGETLSEVQLAKLCHSEFQFWDATPHQVGDGL